MEVTPQRYHTAPQLAPRSQERARPPAWLVVGSLLVFAGVVLLVTEAPYAPSAQPKLLAAPDTQRTHTPAASDLVTGIEEGGVAGAAAGAAAWSRAGGVERRSFGAAVAALAMSGVSWARPAAADGLTFTEVPETEGLKFAITSPGAGDKPIPGQRVQVQYTGWLNGFEKEGIKFDSSRDRRRPLAFTAGKGQVIKGWDISVLDMQVGEKRKVIIPPVLAYGSRGAGGVIPPDATLYFEMELVAVGA